MNNVHKIVKIKKDDEGNVTDVLFENGTILPINHAILRAKQGNIDGFYVAKGKNGGEYLVPDENNPEAHQIDNYPLF